MDALSEDVCTYKHRVKIKRTPEKGPPHGAWEPRAYVYLPNPSTLSLGHLVWEQQDRRRACSACLVLAAQP